VNLHSTPTNTCW